LRVDVPKDANGKRRRKLTTFKGWKGKAEAKLRDLLKSLDDSVYVEPRKPRSGSGCKNGCRWCSAGCGHPPINDTRASSATTSSRRTLRSSRCNSYDLRTLKTTTPPAACRRRRCLTTI